MANFEEREGRGWDSALDAVGYLALVGAGAAKGISYFPNFQRRLAATTIGRLLSKSKKGLYNQISQSLGGYSSIYTRASNPALSWKFQRPTDLTLLHEVQTAISAFRASGVSGANVDDITRSLLKRHTIDVPHAYGSQIPVSVYDVFTTGGSSVAGLAGAVGHERVESLRSGIGQLVKLPGFRQSLSRLNVTEEQFLRQVPVGAFLAKSKEGMFSTRGGLRAMLQDVAGIRVPFTNFRPFGLLIPDLSPKPSMSFLGTATAKALFGAKDALYMGGSLYPITKTGGELQMGRPSPGYRLAAVREEGMAKAAAARMGLLQPGLKTEGWKQSALDIIGRGDLGPEWSGRKSTVGSIISGLKATISGAEVKYPFAHGQALRGATPEGAALKSILGRPYGVAGGPKDLSLFEKLKLYTAGIVRRPFVDDTGRPTTRPVAILSGIESELSAGFAKKAFGWSKTSGVGVEYYATKAGQGLTDWLNYQVSRPLWLMSELTGIGLKPGKSASETMLKIMAKVALPAYLGYQALEYAEYKSSRWLGYGPISLLAMAYTKARVGIQTALDATGLTDTLRDIEEKYPGLVDSPMSRGVRAGASVLAGAFGARALQHPYAKAAAFGAGALAGWLQLAGVSKPADELSRIYSGEQDVPVRSGRGWFLGRTLFTGGKITRWEPSWFAQLQNRPSSVGLYGSRQESWRGSWLPTPENWMLLKNTLDPYYLDRKQADYYPYPQTAGVGGSIPFIGPVFERTLGRMLKPVQRRDMPVGAQSSTEEGIAPIAGYGGQLPIQQGRVASRMDLMTGLTIHRLFDWTGMPGFMVGALREQLLGKDNWYRDQAAVATSAEMASPQRSYYEMNLGGMFGLTEFSRRFLPKDPQMLKINPLPNAWPRWLPGSRSVFWNDRDNSIDFHVGSPISKIEKAEMRMPGPGWDAARGNKTPGIYSAMDRFDIVANLAPGSQAFSHYKREVEGQIHMGLLSKQEIDRFVRVQDQATQQLASKVSNVWPRYGSDAFREQEATIAQTGTTTFSTYEHPGMTFHLAGVEDRRYALDSASDEFGKLKRRMAELQGQRVSVTYGGFGPTTPAILGDVNKYAISAGLGKNTPIDDLDFRAKHGSSLLQRSYEWLLHTNLPGPLGYPRTKWVGQMSPIEEYESFVKSGVWDTGWEQPYSNYIRPWFNQALGTVSGEQLEARRINEYMDKFKFVKYRRLSEQASAIGAMGMASTLDREASKTLVASDPRSPDFYKNIFGALPATERPYFSAFAGVSSEAAQERILQSVPESMKPVYLGVWERRAGTDGFNSPILRRYAEQAKDLLDEVPEARVAEYFAHKPLPDASYAGWHPAISQDTIKIKAAQDEALDAHNISVWPRQEAESTLFDVGAPEEAREAGLSRSEIERLLKRHQLNNVQVFSGFNRSSYRFSRPRSERWEEARNNAYLQGAIGV